MKAITIINFNCWADPFLKRERIKWLIEYITIERPNIILLQELTNDIILILTRKLKNLNYMYTVSNIDRTVYEMICTSFRITDHGFNKYINSTSGRGVLWADIQLNKGLTITVATIQIDTSLLDLNDTLIFIRNRNENVIVGCNTNVIDSLNIKLPSNWKDAWEILGKKEACTFTIDFNRNRNVTNKTFSRPDRILIHGNINPVDFNFIGTDPICGKIKVNPSNHFGIILKIVQQ